MPKKSIPKRIVEDMNRLDIRRLKLVGTLGSGPFQTTTRRDGKLISLVRYSVSSDRCSLTILDANWQPRQTIKMAWVPCHLGGERPYIFCPGCGHRGELLYSDNKGPFRCRTCHDLSYESRNLSDAWRLLHQAWKIQARLGWDGLEGGRPKWMRRATFEQLKAAHDDYDRRSMIAMADALGI